MSAMPTLRGFRHDGGHMTINAPRPDCDNCHLPFDEKDYCRRCAYLEDGVSRCSECLWYVEHPDSIPLAEAI